MEHVKKTNDVDEFFYELLKYAFEHGEQDKMEQLIDRVIEFTRNANQDLARIIAMRQMEQARFATAYTNFILCRDVDHMAITINELSKGAYLKTESDLFVARAMLELYSRTDDFSLPQRLRKEYFAELRSPLLNFVDMLPELIELKDFGLYKELITKYDSQFKRDSNLMNVSQYLICFLTK